MRERDARSSASTARTSRSCPWSTRTSATPHSSPARGWSSRPLSTPPACCQRSDAASTRRRGRGSRVRPGASVHAAERLGLGRRALARHRHVPRPLGRRELRDPAVLAHRQAVGGAAGRATSLVDGALAFWGNPTIRPATRKALVRFAAKAMSDAADAKWKQTSYRFLVANGLRQLIAVSPDLQTS